MFPSECVISHTYNTNDFHSLGKEFYAKIAKENKRRNKKRKENQIFNFIWVISQTSVKIEGVYFNHCLATLAIRKQCIFAEKGSLRGFCGLRLATKLNVLKAQEQGKKKERGQNQSVTFSNAPSCIGFANVNSHI